ncbi:nitrous oxide reductase accessory protein NosL [Pedobacter sp.]
MKNTISILLTVVLFFISCGNEGPEPINYNRDACEFCKMTISESRFAAQLITVKGRVYKFDDLQCLLQYDQTNKEVPVKNYYIANFSANKALIDAKSAYFVKSETLRSPMGGNVAAFAEQKTAAAYASKNQTDIVEWKDLNNTVQTEGGNKHDEMQHH